MYLNTRVNLDMYPKPMDSQVLASVNFTELEVLCDSGYGTIKVPPTKNCLSLTMLPTSTVNLRQEHVPTTRNVAAAMRSASIRF